MNGTRASKKCGRISFDHHRLAFRTSRRFNSEQVSAIFHHPMPLGIAKKIKNAYLTVHLEYCFTRTPAE